MLRYGDGKYVYCENKLDLFGAKMGLSCKFEKLSPQLRKLNGLLFFEFRKSIANDGRYR